MESRGVRALVVLIVLLAIYFGGSFLLKPEFTTDSTNPRFNQYVNYFRRQKGYTVEYRNFTTFPDDVDLMYKPVGSLSPAPLMEIVFCKTVKVYTLGQEFTGTEFEAMMTPASEDRPVTVYYDDEADVIFFKGDYYCSRFFYAARAADRTASYGYYATFTAR